MYKCQKCGTPVIVRGDKLHKGCQCKATVVAEMETKLKGVGGIKKESK